MNRLNSSLTNIARLCGLWLILLAFVPFVLLLVISLLKRGYSEFYVLQFDINAYTKLFDWVYLRVFLESLKLAFVTTIGCLLLAYPFTYFLVSKGLKLRQFLFFLVIVPFWTSSLIRTYALIAIIKTNGLLNSLLLKINIINEPIEILYTDWAVLIGLIYTMLPYMILPLYSNLEKLDSEIKEAARDLGASPSQTFLRVILPLSSPGIVAGIILVFIPSLGLFFIPDILGGSKSLVLGSLIRDQFLITRNWPFGASLSVILTMGMLLLLWIYKWNNRRTGNVDGDLL